MSKPEKRGSLPVFAPEAQDRPSPWSWRLMAAGRTCGRMSWGIPPSARAATASWPSWPSRSWPTTWPSSRPWACGWARGVSCCHLIEKYFSLVGGMVASPNCRGFDSCYQQLFCSSIHLWIQKWSCKLKILQILQSKIPPKQVKKFIFVSAAFYFNRKTTCPKRKYCPILIFFPGLHLINFWAYWNSRNGIWPTICFVQLDTSVTVMEAFATSL